MSEIVLVGAGHVHMAVLEHVARLRKAGHELTLVDPGSFWYGAEPARVVAGRLPRDCVRVALAHRCSRLGVRYLSDRGVGLDVRHRRLWLAGGGRMDYDRVALNIGRETDDTGFDGRAAGVRVWRADSVQELLQMHAALVEDRARGQRPRVAVVGADRRAAEITAGLSMAGFAGACDIAWYQPGARMLAGAPRGAARRVARVLSLRGVDLVMATTIDGVAEGCVHSRDGRRFGADHVVLAARQRSARLIHASGLPADDTGLYVTARLQSPRDARVFASGACARLLGPQELQVADVDRQARVLVANLIAAAANRPMRGYRPSSARVAVDLADGQAVGWRGRIWWHNALAARRRGQRDRGLRERLAAAAR